MHLDTKRLKTKLYKNIFARICVHIMTHNTTMNLTTRADPVAKASLHRWIPLCLTL